MRYPEVEIIVRVGTMDLEIEAWADTGFEGGVTIPASMEHDILAEAGHSILRVADGHALSAPTWAGEVEIGDAVFPCDVIALGKQVLLGLEVLNRIDVSFECGQRLRFNLPDGSEFVQELSLTQAWRLLRGPGKRVW